MITAAASPESVATIQPAKLVFGRCGAGFLSS